MGDEVRSQNVATVSLDRGIWRARIGPPGEGLTTVATSPARAMFFLAGRFQRLAVRSQLLHTASGADVPRRMTRLSVEWSETWPTKIRQE